MVQGRGWRQKPAGRRPKRRTRSSGQRCCRIAPLRVAALAASEPNQTLQSAVLTHTLRLRGAETWSPTSRCRRCFWSASRLQTLDGRPSQRVPRRSQSMQARPPSPRTAAKSRRGAPGRGICEERQWRGADARAAARRRRRLQRPGTANICSCGSPQPAQCGGSHANARGILFGATGPGEPRSGRIGALGRETRCARSTSNGSMATTFGLPAPCLAWPPSPATLRAPPPWLHLQDATAAAGGRVRMSTPSPVRPKQKQRPWLRLSRRHSPWLRRAGSATWLASWPRSPVLRALHEPPERQAGLLCLVSWGGLRAPFSLGLAADASRAKLCRCSAWSRCDTELPVAPTGVA